MLFKGEEQRQVNAESLLNSWTSQKMNFQFVKSPCPNEMQQRAIEVTQVTQCLVLASTYTF